MNVYARRLRQIVLGLGIVGLLAAPLWAKSDGDFTDNNDGTVTDTRSGLMWAKFRVANGQSWATALQTCANLTLAGYSDWRLPNVNEFLSIIDTQRSSPAIYSVFPEANPSDTYWTSTPQANTSSRYYVSISSGLITSAANSGGRSVRCVRP